MGQKVYYKRDQLKSSDSHLYRGPASIIGKRGQIYWLVHQNKVIACSATRLIPVENNEEESWIGLEKNGDFSRPVYKEDDGKVANVDEEDPLDPLSIVSKSDLGADECKYLFIRNKFVHVSDLK